MDAPFASIVRKQVEGLPTDTMLVMSRIAKGHSYEKIKTQFGIGDQTFLRHVLTLRQAFGLEKLTPQAMRERIKELYELQSEFAFGNRYKK